MRVRFGFVLPLLLLAGGCSVSPLSQRATAFSTAATAAVLRVQNAYQLVEQSYAEAQMASLVNNFDTQGFDPSHIQPFMPVDAMQARTQVIAGLKQYAALLAEASGNQPLTALDQQSEALGKSLMGLSASTGLGKVAKNANIEASLASTAVDALGRILIEHKTARNLPEILKRMQGPVDEICQLLQDDIGTPEGGGLRNQLKIDYDNLVADQRSYIYDNESGMTPEEKRTEIEKLPQLVATQQKDDAALVETQAALKLLATTNDALATTRNSKSSPAFRALLLELVAQTRQIDAVYDATIGQ